MELFHQAITLDSTAIQPINNLGFIYYKQEKYDEAKLWIEKAISISPNRLVAYLNLADIELAMGDIKPAISHYEKYLSMAKESEFTHNLSTKVKKLKKSIE